MRQPDGYLLRTKDDGSTELVALRRVQPPAPEDVAGQVVPEAVPVLVEVAEW